VSTIAIAIDGTDITDDVDLKTATFTTLANGSPGTFKIRIRDSNFGRSVRAGAEITLDIGGVRRFGGYVLRPGRMYAFAVDDTSDVTKTTRYLTIEGVDYNVLFERRVVRDKADPANVALRSWAKGSHDDTIIKYVFDNYTDLGADGVTYDGVTHVGSPNPDKAGVVASGGLRFGDAMREINRLISAVWHIGPDKDLKFVDVDIPDASVGMSDQPGAGQIGYREFSHVSNGTGLVNDAMVWGAGIGAARMAFGRVQSAPSQAAHGLWQYGEFTTQLFRQTSVDERAGSIVNGTPQSKRGGKDDQISWNVTTYDPSFVIGQKVAIESNVYGVSDVVPIRRMTITFPTPTDARFDMVLSHEIDDPWNMFEFLFPRITIPQLPTPQVPPFPRPGGGGGGGGCTDAICGITDNFENRTRPTDWGTASGGYPYLGDTTQGTFSLLNVDSGSGRIGLATGTAPITFNYNTEVTLNKSTKWPVDTIITLEMQNELATNVRWLYGDPSGQSASFAYAPSTHVFSLEGWTSFADFTGIVLSTTVNTKLRMFIDNELVGGLQMKFKVWAATDPEPASWTGEYTESAITPTTTQAFSMRLLQTRVSGSSYGETKVYVEDLDIIAHGDHLSLCSSGGQHDTGEFDTFARGLGSDWGTSQPTFHDWGILSTDASAWGVDTDGGYAVLDGNGFHGIFCDLTSFGTNQFAGDFDELFTIGYNQTVPAGEALFWLFTVSDGTMPGPGAGVSLNVTPDNSSSSVGPAYLQLAEAGGTFVTFDLPSIPPPNTPIFIRWTRIASSGEQSAKVWWQGQSEPSGWQVTGTFSAGSPASLYSEFDHYRVSSSLGELKQWVAHIASYLSGSGSNPCFSNCNEHEVVFDDFDETHNGIGDYSWGTYDYGGDWHGPGNQNNLTSFVSEHDGIGWANYPDGGGEMTMYTDPGGPWSSGQFNVLVHVRAPDDIGAGRGTSPGSVYLSILNAIGAPDLDFTKIDAIVSTGPDPFNTSAEVRVFGTPVVDEFQYIPPINEDFFIRWEYVGGQYSRVKLWGSSTPEPAAWSASGSAEFAPTLGVDDYLAITMQNYTFGIYRVTFYDVCGDVAPAAGSGSDGVVAGLLLGGVDLVAISSTVFGLDPPAAYVPGSTRLWADGIFQRPSVDYTESDPSLGQITLTAAPTDPTSVHMSYTAAGGV
jgi:hypothetical protein